MQICMLACAIQQADDANHHQDLHHHFDKCKNASSLHVSSTTKIAVIRERVSINEERLITVNWKEPMADMTIANVGTSTFVQFIAEWR